MISCAILSPVWIWYCVCHKLIKITVILPVYHWSIIPPKTWIAYWDAKPDLGATHPKYPGGNCIAISVGIQTCWWGMRTQSWLLYRSYPASLWWVRVGVIAWSESVQYLISSDIAIYIYNPKIFLIPGMRRCVYWLISDDLIQSISECSSDSMMFWSISFWVSWVQSYSYTDTLSYDQFLICCVYVHKTIGLYFSSKVIPNSSLTSLVRVSYVVESVVSTFHHGRSKHVSNRPHFLTKNKYSLSQDWSSL